MLCFAERRSISSTLMNISIYIYATVGITHTYSPTAVFRIVVNMALLNNICISV